MTHRLIAMAWFGMVIGVSLIATPAKFLVAELSLPVALAIGRTTFEIFNRLELLSLVTLTLSMPARWRERAAVSILILLALVMLLQSLWLIPALSARVAMVIAGQTPPDNPVHAIYVAAEAVKLAALLALAFSGPLARPASTV